MDKPGVTGFLVIAREATLTAKQRTEVAEVVNRRKLKGAVILTSAIQRGVVTAIGWLVGGDRLRSYAPKEMDAALEFLGDGNAGEDVAAGAAGHDQHGSIRVHARAPFSKASGFTICASDGSARVTS